MSLTTPFRVQKLQTALHAKAKESPNIRLHALYDQVYRKDVLAYAYERCKANGGAAGVDKQDIREHRSVRQGTVVGRTGARAEKSNLSTTFLYDGSTYPSRMGSRDR